MDWLEPPWQFFRIEPEHPITIPVMRYQVGMAQRPIADPPGFQDVLTIRFHIPYITGWGLQPYVDFGNRILIQKVLRLYNELIERSPTLPMADRIRYAIRLAPSTIAPLVLRLTRHGERIDTWYDVEALEP